MNFLRERIDLTPSPTYPFHILATKYDYAENRYRDSDDAFTLILLHALGVHMETWEVTVARMFALCSSGASPVKIRDVFSIESPNHGQSSAINGSEIAKRSIDWPEEYAKAVQRFLTAGPSTGAKVDFATRKLVGICHSVGAGALFLAAQAEPALPFKAIIAFEPGVTDKHSKQRIRATVAATAYAWLRPDVWRSRKAARKVLQASPVYAFWDPRVFELFMEYGLIDHPASKHPAPYTFPGVVTALSRDHHARCYMSDKLYNEGLEAYGQLTRKIPVHLVWGAIHELADVDLKNFMSNLAAGRTPVSVSEIEDAGHMVVQQKPDECGDVILAVLLTESKPMAHL
ncbi:Alpha/beta hydrolase fold-1 [Mycena sp. CBHHK59/15]|nr:Alpha/beta hydrolase fold-1 [Mycena sp. CBHHK59/15]